jgi:hypothetical protein
MIPPTIKDRLKTLRKKVFNAYAERFLRFTVADLEAVLRSAGVRTADVLFIHSSLDVFAGFQGKVVDIIALLQRMVGPEGTLLMPQQPFSGSAISGPSPAKYSTFAAPRPAWACCPRCSGGLPAWFAASTRPIVWPRGEPVRSP